MTSSSAEQILSTSSTVGTDCVGTSTQGGDELFNTVSDAASHAPVPELKQAAEVTMKIVEMIQDATVYETEFKAMAHEAMRVVETMYLAFKQPTKDILSVQSPNDINVIIGEFLRILEEIDGLVKNQGTSTTEDQMLLPPFSLVCLDITKRLNVCKRNFQTTPFMRSTKTQKSLRARVQAIDIKAHEQMAQRMRREAHINKVIEEYEKGMIDMEQLRGELTTRKYEDEEKRGQPIEKKAEGAERQTPGTNHIHPVPSFNGNEMNSTVLARLPDNVLTPPHVHPHSPTIHSAGSARSSPGPKIQSAGTDTITRTSSIRNDALQAPVSLDKEQMEYFDATTCWIAAEQAWHHLKGVTSQLVDMFARRNILYSEYAVHAGFDESLIEAGVGYLEQIHVFVSDNVHPTSDLISELGEIFYPFSAILFTESSSYPVSSPNNIGSPSELGKLAPPTVISIAQAPNVASGPSGFSQGSFDNGEGDAEGNKNWRSDKGKKRDNGDRNKLNKEGENDEDPQDTSTNESKAISIPTITFAINSEIHAIEDSPTPIQTLTMRGRFTIKTTSLDDQCHERRVQFEELKFGAEPMGLHYKQSYVKVDVDSHEISAYPKGIKPRRTSAFAERQVKESSITTDSHARTKSAGINAGVNPQAMLGFSSTSTRAVGQGSEMLRNTSRITQQDKSGVVSWGFNIDDPDEQTGGIDMPDDMLPAVDFEFVGTSSSSEVSASLPPARTDVEITSCWSIITSRSSVPKSSRWISDILRKFSRSSDGTLIPSYSNLCQITAFETVPSALPPRSHYVATLHAVRGPADSKLTVYDTKVIRGTDPSLVVTPEVNSSSEEARDCGRITDLRASTLKLPSITKVKLSGNTRQLQENMGNSSKSY